jgi:hypothetical protein
MWLDSRSGQPDCYQQSDRPDHPRPRCCLYVRTPWAQGGHPANRNLVRHRRSGPYHQRPDCWAYGRTPLAAATFSGLSIAADLLAIVLPSTALALWWNRRHLLATAAWATWTLAVTMAILASLGFASLHLGDTAAGRAAIVSTAVATADQRNATIEAARAAAQAATVARQGECQRRGPLCRDLEHVEQARMSELTATIALPIPTVAAIADADPQVTATVRLARWVGLGVTATDVGNLRLALMALLPNIAGLVLCFGMAQRRD